MSSCYQKPNGLVPGHSRTRGCLDADAHRLGACGHRLLLRGKRLDEECLARRFQGCAADGRRQTCARPDGAVSGAPETRRLGALARHHDLPAVPDRRRGNRSGGVARGRQVPESRDGGHGLRTGCGRNLRLLGLQLSAARRERLLPLSERRRRSDRHAISRQLPRRACRHGAAFPEEDHAGRAAGRVPHGRHPQQPGAVGSAGQGERAGAHALVLHGRVSGARRPARIGQRRRSHVPQRRQALQGAREGRDPLRAAARQSSHLPRRLPRLSRGNEHLPSRADADGQRGGAELEVHGEARHRLGSLVRRLRLVGEPAAKPRDPGAGDAAARSVQADGAHDVQPVLPAGSAVSAAVHRWRACSCSA